MLKQDQAFNRLLKKLSALRATLKSDERNLLDGLVTRPIDEVSAHALNVTPISPAKNPKALEVAAHALNVRTAKSPAKNPAASEVAAHGMSIQIIYDQTKDEYQRIS